jgi:hypothetical protein
VNWEPSSQADEFGGCRSCVHYQGGGRCAAFPKRIPLPIFAGDIDHMIVRPGQVGTNVFEPIDFEVWQATGERRPATPRTAAARRT